MTLFQPRLTLLRGPGKGRYTLESTTDTPHDGYYFAGIETGAPTGVILVPEAFPLQLKLRECRGTNCYVRETEVRHHYGNFRVPAGKSSIVCFVMLNGAVVGSASIDLSAATQLAPAATPQKAFRTVSLNIAADGILSFSEALTIVLNNVPDRNAFTGDSTISLRLLGIVSDTFSNALRDGIVSDLRGFFTINPTLIRVAPGESLNSCIQSVVANPRA